MTYANLEQLSNVLKLTPQMINRHVKDHGMPRISRGEYDLVKCVHWYIDYLNERIKEASRGTESEAQGRQRLIIATADLRELELSVACAELIEIDVAAELWQKIAVTFRTKMMLIPTKLAPQIINCKDPNEAQLMLETEIQEALLDLSQTKIDTSSLRRRERFGRFRPKNGRTSSKAKRKRVGG